MIRVEEPKTSRVPIVFDSPHSGADYPDDFVSLVDQSMLRQCEDAHIDALYSHVTEQGAPLLHALFPRCYIDPNRSEDDISPEMVDGKWPGKLNPSIKAEHGIGLIWCQTGSSGTSRIRKLTVEQIQSRIETCWRPYHVALLNLLNDVRKDFGYVFHINCHSMPSRSDPLIDDWPNRRADFVLGDRDHTTCDTRFTYFAADVLRQMGYSVALNDPYKGVELIRRYSDPRRGVHSLQVEINRKLYMNEQTTNRNDGYDALQDNLVRFTAALVAYTQAGSCPTI